jgi:hypothetical protein
MRAYTGVLAVLASLASASSPAFAYTALYAFGDSLSDVGNAYIASGLKVPISPYDAGRFSNGPIWLEDLATKLHLAPVMPSLAGGTDFAFGGAQTESRGQKGMPPGRPLRSFDLCGLLRARALAVDPPDPCDHQGSSGPARNRDYRPPRDTAGPPPCLKGITGWAADHTFKDFTFEFGKATARTSSLRSS